MVLYDPDPTTLRSWQSDPHQYRSPGLPHEGSEVSERVTVSIGMVLVAPGSGRSAAGRCSAPMRRCMRRRKRGAIA